MPSSKDIEQEYLKILSMSLILTSIKGHNSVTKKQKITANNPNLDLVIFHAHTKFGEILSICSQDIERKPNLGVNEGP